MDHKHSDSFTLKKEGKGYTDDPNNYYAIENGNLVFILLAVRNSLSFDDSHMFTETQVALDLLEDSKHSFSTVGNIYLSIVATVLIVLLFFGLVAILIPSLRQTMFGVFLLRMERKTT